MHRAYLLVNAVLVFAVALPSIGATISEELSAAEALVREGKLSDAATHLRAAEDLAGTDPETLNPTELMALAQVHRLQMALTYDAAMRTGKLTPGQLAEAVKWRRRVLEVRNTKRLSGDHADLMAELVPGRTNIVCLLSSGCSGCVQLLPYLEVLADSRDDLFLIVVDINRPDTTGIDWSSPTVARYGLQFIPQFGIYGPDKTLQAHGEDARAKLVAMIQAKLEHRDAFGAPDLSLPKTPYCR